MISWIVETFQLKSIYFFSFFAELFACFPLFIPTVVSNRIFYAVALARFLVLLPNKHPLAEQVNLCLDFNIYSVLLSLYLYWIILPLFFPFKFYLENLANI